MTISRAEYESLKAERDELNQKLDWLMEQVRLAKKKVYGTSSEQTKEELVGQLSFMFDETEAWLSTRRTATRETRVAAHTRQKRSSRVEEVLPENIPVEVVEHRVPESERNCPECGTLMTEIGTEVRRTLVMVPAQVKIREDVYFTYACQNCKQTGTETPILKAPKEPPLISGSYASPEAVAHIMVQKFVMYAPLYRQEQEWNRAGVMLSRQTMSNWVLRVAEDWLRPIYDHLHRQLLQREVLLYPDVARLLHKKPETVYKSVIRLAHRCWDALVEQDLVLSYLGRSMKQEPDPSVFITYLAVYIQSDIPFFEFIERDPGFLFRDSPDIFGMSDIPPESTTKLLLRNKPLLVSQAMAFTSPAGLTTFPVCPACMATLEREGQNFCDHCGQRLDWRWYKHAQIIYPGQKSALNILDKDDVLIST